MQVQKKSLPLQPLWERNTPRKRKEKGSERFFENSSQKIWRLKFLALSLHPLSPRNENETKAKFLKKSCEKVCKFKILALPLQSVRVTKTTNVFKLVLWFTGYILREKECSIYLSILFNFERSEIVRTLTIHFNFYNGEFDPGSGWTLAAGLTHASRGAAQEVACYLWWRPAHGCVTRMQPTHNRGITLRNWY